MQHKNAGPVDKQRLALALPFLFALFARERGIRAKDVNFHEVLDHGGDVAAGAARRAHRQRQVPNRREGERSVAARATHGRRAHEAPEVIRHHGVVVRPEVGEPALRRGHVGLALDVLHLGVRRLADAIKLEVQRVEEFADELVGVVLAAALELVVERCGARLDGHEVLEAGCLGQGAQRFGELGLAARALIQRCRQRVQEESRRVEDALKRRVHVTCVADIPEADRD